ncbi:MAG: hypothetical protein J2P57_12630 [Acidimicrobiaceae bacterium]|nr:hypothetical protein [Acidimicrobiaceae bacterium]
MSAVVAVEAAVILLLALFVTGLLRSYAGLLKRVDEIEMRPASAVSMTRVPARLPETEATHRPVGNLAGVTAWGDPLTVAVTGVEHATLLAFLSSSCSSCRGFWAALGETKAGDLPNGVRLVAVTKSAEQESPSAIAELAPPHLDVVMSSQAWTDYGVPGTPYFVFVDGPSGAVAGEGTALDWGQVRRLMALANGDSRLAAGTGASSPKARPDVEREVEIDRVLMRSGLFPGDPSLYPPRGRSEE